MAALFDYMLGKLRSNTASSVEDATHLGFATPTKLTIATGAITVTQATHTVEGEGAAADDLATINGGDTNDLVMLLPFSAAHNITVKHGAGNLVTPTGMDYTIPDDAYILLYKTATNWLMLGAAVGGMGGDVTGGALSVDGEIVIYDGITGKKIKQNAAPFLLPAALPAATYMVSCTAAGQLGYIETPSPAVDDFLGWNGTLWTNRPVPSGAIGSGIEVYDDATSVIAKTADNAFAVVTLAMAPSGAVETVVTTSCATNTVPAVAMLSDVLGRTSIPAGVWFFETFAAVDTIASGRVSTLTKGFYRVIPDAVNTVTVSGILPTTRTVTPSGGTPFAAGDANADQTLCGYVQTVAGLYPIVSYNAGTGEVDITVPAGYTNEVAVAFSTWKYQFQSTTDAITAVGTNYSRYESVSVQSAAIVLAATDRVGSIVFATSNNTTDVKFVYQGTEHYSHICTPMASLHNDLSGLQGGTSGQYYHLTSAQATSVAGAIAVNGVVQCNGSGTFSAASVVLKAGDTMTGQLYIDGSADQIQFKVDGHSTQTNKIMQVNTSAGAELFSIDKDGMCLTQGKFGWGDGDTYIYELVDDYLYVYCGGVGVGFYTPSGFYMTSGAGLDFAAPTATDPSMGPSISFDADTGLGTAGADQLSLIAGGIQVAKCLEATYFQLIVAPGAVQNLAATPVLAFGDADTGLYESTDDALWVSCGGSDAWLFSGSTCGMTSAGRARIQNEAPTVTNPVFTIQGDEDTGIGWGAGDNLSLVAGGVQVANIATAKLTVYTASAFQHADGIEVGKDDAPNVAGKMKWWSAGANNYYMTLTAATMSANATYTWPTAMPAVTGYALTCTDAGVMSWASISATLAGAVTGNITCATNFQVIFATGGLEATPSLAFGDGDSGFVESGDDQIFVVCGGTARWMLSAASLGSNDSGRPLMMNEASSGTNPVFCVVGDSDTGLGNAAADQLSLIAGGVQVAKCLENTYSQFIISPGITGSVAATPHLAFGDGDSGFYEISDDSLRLSLGGTDYFMSNVVSAVGYLGGVAANAPVMSNTSGSATVPQFTFEGDVDTGFARSAANTVALIAGGTRAGSFNSTCSVWLGINNTSSGEASVALGANNSATGTGAIALGRYAAATRWGQMAFASGGSAAGDMQATRMEMKATTTDGTPTEATDFNGTPDYFTITSGKTYAFEIHVVGVETGGVSGTAGATCYHIHHGVIKNVAGTTSIQGTPTMTVVEEYDASFNSAVTATDGTSDRLTVTVTGAAAKNVTWLVDVNMREIKFA